jgi:hypothetical protein
MSSDAPSAAREPSASGGRTRGLREVLAYVGIAALAGSGLIWLRAYGLDDRPFSAPIGVSILTVAFLAGRMPLLGVVAAALEIALILRQRSDHDLVGWPALVLSAASLLAFLASRRASSRPTPRSLAIAWGACTLISVAYATWYAHRPRAGVPSEIPPSGGLMSVMVWPKASGDRAIAVRLWGKPATIVYAAGPLAVVRVPPCGLGEIPIEVDVDGRPAVMERPLRCAKPSSEGAEITCAIREGRTVRYVNTLWDNTLSPDDLARRVGEESASIVFHQPENRRRYLSARRVDGVWKLVGDSGDTTTSPFDGLPDCY